MHWLYCVTEDFRRRTQQWRYQTMAWLSWNSQFSEEWGSEQVNSYMRCIWVIVWVTKKIKHMTEQRAGIEADTMASGFWGKNKLYCNMNLQGDRRPSSNLFPKSGIQSNFHELGENGLVCRNAGGTGCKSCGIFHRQRCGLQRDWYNHCTAVQRKTESGDFLSTTVEITPMLYQEAYP